MFCTKCGNRLDDHDMVCSRCGTPVKKKLAEIKREEVNQDVLQEDFTDAVTELVSMNKEKNEGYQADSNGEQDFVSDKPKPGIDIKKKKGGRGCLTVILVLAMITVFLAAGAWLMFLKTDRKANEPSLPGSLEETEETLETDSIAIETQATLAQEDTEETEPELQFDEEDQTVPMESELARTIAKYNEGSDSGILIDVFAENFTPGNRNPNYTWDKTLFYTLEDISPESSADGIINSYHISRKMLKNSATGNKMEYEIYTSPSTGKVNKIVSIEYVDDYLELTDYYYDDSGKISFIFVRKDINYIPAYAVPTKDGQRFYFNNDCMTKWRVVNNGVQSNYVIGPQSAQNNPEGSVFEYSDLETGAKENYDSAEKRMINAAYNTYNTVLLAEGISEIIGYVYDESGQAVSAARVELVSDDTGEMLYETETDNTGIYRISVPSEEAGYHLLISSEGCAVTTVYGVEVSSQILSDYQDNVYMVEQDDKSYPINVQVYDALHVAADGNGMERLSNAGIYIRDGVNHRDGGVVAQGTSDANGMVSADLPPGMYTAEVMKEGYDNTYYNFAVKDDQDTVQINASPKLAEGEVRIVLTWGETPRDLDSHLFTPYDDSFEDLTYHIWYGNKSDAVGNNLDVDDTTGYGPETMTIPLLKNGLYKYYVADFTNCNSDNPASYEMSNSGAMVNVYTSNGLTSTFMVPSNRAGTIWEVFEIRNGAIVPSQRYYANIDDKSWWHNDK